MWYLKDLVSLYIINLGIRISVKSRLDVVMLVMRSSIVFFIFRNVMMRRVFFIKDVKSVKKCIVIIILFGNIIL